MNIVIMLRLCIINTGLQVLLLEELVAQPYCEFFDNKIHLKCKLSAQDFLNMECEFKYGSENLFHLSW